MDLKTFRGSVKSLDDGSALVVIATLNVKDQDGDVTLPGYFGKQTAQAIGAHNWQSVPIGKATVYEQGDEALALLKFNLATSAGKDWREAIKFDYENAPAVQEYSYGYTIKPGGSRFGLFGGNGTPENPGEEVRFLVPLGDGMAGCAVHEVSPVLLGAGVDTRTVDAKGRTYAAEMSTLLAGLKSIEKRTQELAALRAKDKRVLSPAHVTELKTLRDELGRFAQALGPLIEPAASVEEAARLFAEFQRTTFELARLGA